MVYFRKILFTLFMVLPLSTPATDHQEGLLLVQDGVERLLSLDEIQAQARTTIELYEPFRREQIQVRGIRLVNFIERHFEGTPMSIELVAHNDYTVELSDWQDRNWILITHENDRPLTLRNHGPIRLVQEDLRERDPEILRDFADWIWMIKQIEANP